jgi:Uma2 family endonuclease
MMTHPFAPLGIVRGVHLPLSHFAEQFMAMPAIRRRWTAADVRALISEDRAWPRYELIAGELLVTPAPRTVHQIAVTEILLLIKEYLDHEPVGIVLPSPADLELVPGTVTQPDLFVIPGDTHARGELLEWQDVKSLLLAVEVLSPSSLHTDRVVKRDFYCDAGVPDYWIVDLDARVVERWTPNSETPEIHRDRIEWSPRGAKPLFVDLAGLFAAICKTAGALRL